MNFKTFAAIAGFTLATTLSSISGAAAYTVHGNVSIQGLNVQVATVTPLAMRYLCAQSPRDCQGGGASRVTASPNLMQVLAQVNQHVNRSIRPVADSADRWTANATSGDCEDFVLAKRRALISKGVPAGSLRIALTHTRSGAPHAVLVVRTSGGDYVLDNLNNSVKTLRSSGYNIRSMSSSNPNSWVAG